MSIEDLVDGKLQRRSGSSDAQIQVVETSIHGEKYRKFILLYSVGYPQKRGWMIMQPHGSFYHFTYLAEKLGNLSERELYDVTLAMHDFGFNVSFDPEFKSKMEKWKIR